MSEYKPGIVKDGPDWPLPVCDTNGKLADENARLRARVAVLEQLTRESLNVLRCADENGDDPGHRCSHCDDYVDRNGPHRDALRAALKETKP